MISMRFLLASIIIFLAGCGSESQLTSEDSALERIKKSGTLHWGADVIGGIPYVYEDPENPGSYIGFEVDIAIEIAKILGVKQKLVIRAWDSLIPELQAKSYDIAMNGIEDTEERRQIVQYTKPYYVYAQQITVRRDNTDINSLKDLSGKTVGTLSGSAAEDLLRAEKDITVSINPEIIYSYKDLEIGKVDAVVLDVPIAVAYGATNPQLKNVGNTFATGRYVIAVRDEDTSLKEAIDQAISTLKVDGTLAKIYKKWGLLNPDQGEIGIR